MGNADGKNPKETTNDTFTDLPKDVATLKPPNQNLRKPRSFSLNPAALIKSKPPQDDDEIIEIKSTIPQPTPSKETPLHSLEILPTISPLIPYTHQLSVSSGTPTSFGIISHEPLLNICLALQDHFRTSTKLISDHQEVLNQKIRDVDASSLKNLNNVRQQAFYTKQIDFYLRDSLHGLSDQIEKTQHRIHQAALTCEKLNSLLPDSHKLPNLIFSGFNHDIKYKNKVSLDISEDPYFRKLDIKSGVHTREATSVKYSQSFSATLVYDDVLSLFPDVSFTPSPSALYFPSHVPNTLPSLQLYAICDGEVESTMLMKSIFPSRFFESRAFTDGKYRRAMEEAFTATLTDIQQTLPSFSSHDSSAIVTFFLGSSLFIASLSTSRALLVSSSGYEPETEKKKLKLQYLPRDLGEEEMEGTLRQKIVVDEIIVGEEDRLLILGSSYLWKVCLKEEIYEEISSALQTECPPVDVSSRLTQLTLSRCCLPAFSVIVTDFCTKF